MGIKVIPSGYRGEEKLIRFDIRANSWQYKGTSFGWFDISVSMARSLFDQGWKVWGV